MDEVWGAKFDHERGNDIGEENDCFGHVGTDEIESGGEDNHVENVVD